VNIKELQEDIRQLYGEEDGEEGKAEGEEYLAAEDCEFEPLELDSQAVNSQPVDLSQFSQSIAQTKSSIHSSVGSTFSSQWPKSLSEKLRNTSESDVPASTAAGTEMSQLIAPEVTQSQARVLSKRVLASDSDGEGAPVKTTWSARAKKRQICRVIEDDEDDA
jgi:hypothetical protein